MEVVIKNMGIDNKDAIIIIEEKDIRNSIDEMCKYGFVDSIGISIGKLVIRNRKAKVKIVIEYEEIEEDEED